MFSKLTGLIMMIFVNGLIALCFAIGFALLMLLIAPLIMIPVNTFASTDMATSIGNGIYLMTKFKTLYSMFFILLVLDDLGIKNVKTLFKNLFKNKKAGQNEI